MPKIETRIEKFLRNCISLYIKYLTITGTLHHGVELWETVGSGLHQIVVNGEAADVETSGGDIVVSAALSHIDHSRGDVSHLQRIVFAKYLSV